MSDVLMFSSVAMLVLLFLKVPVFVAVLGGSLIYFLMNPDINSLIFAQQMILGTEKISLLAIPFFVCAGIVMNYTGVTKRIMDFCEIVTAHLPGGQSPAGRGVHHLPQHRHQSGHHRRGHGSQNADPGNDAKRVLPVLFQCSYGGFLYDHAVDPPRHCHDFVWLHCECFHRQAFHLRYRGRVAALYLYDDPGWHNFQKEELRCADPGKTHL